MCHQKKKYTNNKTKQKKTYDDAFMQHLKVAT